MQEGGILSSQSGFGAHSNALSYGILNASEYWGNLDDDDQMHMKT